MKYDDTEFMNELEAAMRLKPATPAMVLLFSIMALFVFLMIWAGVSQVEQLTRGQGQVVPTQEIQVVQSLEGGIVAEVLVKEGEAVKKDQVLLRLSDVQFSSEERGTEARYLSLVAKKARLKAEAAGEEFIVPEEVSEKAPKIADNEMQLYRSRQNELKTAYGILDDKIAQSSADISEIKAQINRLSESRGHIQNELSITRDMVAKRAVSKMEQMRLERELSDAEGQINANVQRRRSLESELEVSRKERRSQEEKFRTQALGELGEVETQLSGLQENLKSIGDRVYRTELRAPVDGIVNNIAVKTIGGIVEPAMRLVEIVPVDDELKILARVLPSDIAFLRPGQDAKVKITAYDAQKYGTLKGKLSRIGANSVSDKEGNVFFEVEVITDKNHMGTVEKPLPITPGMVANIEVITGTRTILEYLLKPVLRARSVALTER